MVRKIVLAVTGITLMLILFLSYAVFSQTTGQFTVGNEAPTIVANSLEVQDSATTWDSTTFNTHDVTPSLRWVVNDKNLDTLNSSVCISSFAGSSCDVLAETLVGTYSSDDTVTYGYVGSSIAFTAGDCTATDCSKTYYFTVYVTDGEFEISQEQAIEFVNSVPAIPSGLSITETHDQTPDLSWTSVDADDGTRDKWPADILTYHIQVGTGYGDESYLTDSAGVSASASVTNTIPWGIPGISEARQTTYARIWTIDNLGISSANYDATFDLVDNLPVFENLYISDAVINPVTDSCVDFLPQNCFIYPLFSDYTSVNILLSISDSDGDCSSLTHSADVVLCMVDAGGAEVCNSVTNADYSYSLSYDSGDGTNCDFSISVPIGDANGIEFFKAPGKYKLFIKSDSQAGTSTTPWNYGWEYSTLPAVDYVTSVLLGDGVIGLGEWNPGTTLATLVNSGNLLLNLEWEATDASSDSSTCSGHTSTCWDLSTADDLQVDDDNLQGELTETSLAPANIPEEPARVVFQPVGGLAVCDSMTCDNIALSETLNTYFHIKPPVGLIPGDYETIFTITY